MNTLLSIMTLYQYDPTLFDEVVIPTGMDKEILTDNLVIELAELELLYNDPYVLKFAMGAWSKKEIINWQKLYDTTNLDYNPIENYNRTDHTTDKETRDLNLSDSETRALETTISGTTGTSDIDVSSGGDSNIQSKTGYNSGTLQDAEKNETTLGSTNTKNVNTTTAQTGGDTGTVVNVKTDVGTIENEKDYTSTGNIGVKTTQEMINEEREIVKLNMYDYITEAFKQRFFIMVY